MTIQLPDIHLDLGWPECIWIATAIVAVVLYWGGFFS